jgi:hypothetical protein
MLLKIERGIVDEEIIDYVCERKYGTDEWTARKQARYCAGSSGTNAGRSQQQHGGRRALRQSARRHRTNNDDDIPVRPEELDDRKLYPCAAGHGHPELLGCFFPATNMMLHGQPRICFGCRLISDMADFQSHEEGLRDFHDVLNQRWLHLPAPEGPAQAEAAVASNATLQEPDAESDSNLANVETPTAAAANPSDGQAEAEPMSELERLLTTARAAVPVPREEDKTYSQLKAERNYRRELARLIRDGRLPEGTTELPPRRAAFARIPKSRRR